MPRGGGCKIDLDVRQWRCSTGKESDILRELIEAAKQVSKHPRHSALRRTGGHRCEHRRSLREGSLFTMIDERATDESWMRLALAQARYAWEQGEVPIGAVVVRAGEVIASGCNLRETWRDPTAHAELIAIQEASRRLGAWRLTECDLYVTLEPCPMCAGAIMLSRIRRLVFGATDRKGGAVVSKAALLEPGLWNHTPNIASGVLADECANILKDFFKTIRA